MSDNPAPQQKCQIEEEAPLEIILQLALRYWYLFIISLIICLGAGYFYSQTLSYKYSSSATILIKGKKEHNPLTMFEDMGVMNGVSPIENEIIQLKSSQLMMQVIDRLNICIQYSVKPRLRRTDIYGANPIEMEIIDRIDDKSIALTIIPHDAESFYYSLESNYESGSPLSSAKFGQDIKLGVNTIRIKHTRHWGNRYQENAIHVHQLEQKLYAKGILSRMIVTRTNKVTDAVKLSITDGNAQRAKDILSVLIDVYNEEVIAQKNATALKAESFIADRINIIYANLSEVDSNLEDYKKDNEIITLKGVAGAAFATSVKYQEEISSIDMQITMIKSVSDSMQSPGIAYDVIPPNRAFVELQISDQIDNYNVIVMKLQELQKNAGANNPIVVKLKHEIASSNKNTLIAISNLIANLEFRKKQLISKELEVQTQIKALPSKEKIVRDVMREQGIKEELYLYMLNKREANNLQLAITESNVTIIEPAESARAPVAPQPLKILAFAGVLGLVLPSGFIFLLQLRNKIECRDDIRGCNIPLLGILPHKSKNQKNKQLIVKEDTRDALSEGFRVVANNIGYFIQTSDKSKGGKVIQITSTIPNEGKTFTSLNLALSLSFTNRKIVLVDIDMRRRGLSQLIDKTREKLGLSRYLRNHDTSIEDLITKNIDGSQLDFIKLGSVPPNAAQLLTTERFDDFLAQLRSRYDIIIIDSAPYFAVADSQIINKFADMTIWVIRSGKLSKKLLPELEQLQKEKKVNNMAILLNDAELNNQGYGYGYGYGETEKS